MPLVIKKTSKRKQGSGLFSSLLSGVSSVIANKALKETVSEVGKHAANELGKVAVNKIVRVIDPPQAKKLQVEILTQAIPHTSSEKLTPEAQRIKDKYFGNGTLCTQLNSQQPTTQTPIAIQDLVKKINRGSGFKKS
jgi:hypothetical protein